MTFVRDNEARISSCKLLDRPAPSGSSCLPLSVSKSPYSITVAPYLSEVPRDVGAAFSRLSQWERKEGWPAATENRMRTLDRIKRWIEVMNLATREAGQVGVTIGLSRPDLELDIRAFDASDPHRFVDTHWDRLSAVNIVATHKYLIVPLLKTCKRLSWWTALMRSRKLVPNGAVLETSWVRGRQTKKIFFVRHCRSCANALKEHGRTQLGSKATMCMDVDAILESRCVLSNAIDPEQLAKQEVQLFSSGQPRAIQTALALISDAVDLRWLRGLSSTANMYTDCGDVRFKRTLSAQ